ncbi:MAG: hypothetical protein OQJ96_03680 [Flavobacteriales bacterium]|jgi:hypothetical protein|nr:hypothetical protein [Flavobacteriales bacterium]MBQ20284.1 hypothetical protein [Flavobacteriales bacterium]MCW8896489.1 hypothetical protein [Flavobacteriales bacterium]MCW8912458.1 hypothetical protein [Flavobacteriales bacterium]MCW8936542.1 hypothetical protein [Flavobacteriales bacterium]|tara:strand:+ start:209715 stop:209969 length:255 start_codon:yes stop_codon:yes gene_type:complete
MKKVLALLMVAGMFSLVACGPSEEEKAAAEAEAQKIADDLMKGLEEAVEEEPTAEVEEEVTEEEATEEEAPKEETEAPAEETAE